jgi:hypothetical protein
VPTLFSRAIISDNVVVLALIVPPTDEVAEKGFRVISHGYVFSHVGEQERAFAAVTVVPKHTLLGVALGYLC